jgi:transcriptional antiterminator
MHISNNQKTMTVKEIAKAFNCKERTIQYRAKEMFPELVRNGVETRLNEAQVTAIKLKLDKNYSLASGSKLPKTALEEDLIIRHRASR